MRSHKKVMISNALPNLIWIPLWLYVMPNVYYVTATDTDLDSHAMGENPGPAATVVSSALIVALLYLDRNLVTLVAGITRKLHRRG